MINENPNYPRFCTNCLTLDMHAPFLIDMICVINTDRWDRAMDIGHIIQTIYSEMAI